MCSINLHMMNRRWKNKLAFSYPIFQQTVIEIGQCGFDAENIGFIFWTVCAYIEFSGSSIHRNIETVCVSVCFGDGVCLAVCFRVDPDSSLYADMQVMREKEGHDNILFNFTFKVHTHSFLYTC